MSSEKQRTRALFKKGQKCIHPIVEDRDDGGTETVFYAGIIQHGEKRSHPQTGEPTYFYWIHYPGWSNKHDTEVEESELMKYDVNLLTGGTSAAVDAARERAAVLQEAKRQRERLIEIPAHLRFRVPVLLKQILLQDYEQIMQCGRCLPLPRSMHSRPSAAQVVRDWQEFRKADEDEDVCAQIDEIADSFVEYFNAAIYHFLLYSHEVGLHDRTMKELAGNGFPPSEVYGAEHLVRLIVKLPELVAVRLMTVGAADARNVVTVEDEIEDFMAWTISEDRHASLFSKKDEYVENPDYVAPLVMPPNLVGGGGGKGDGRKFVGAGGCGVDGGGGGTATGTGVVPTARTTPAPIDGDGGDGGGYT